MFNLFKKLQAENLHETKLVSMPDAQETDHYAFAQEQLKKEASLIRRKMVGLEKTNPEYTKLDEEFKQKKEILTDKAKLDEYAKKLDKEKKAKAEESGTGVDNTGQSTQNVEEGVKKLQGSEDKLKSDLNNILEKAKPQLSNSQNWVMQIFNAAFNYALMGYHGKDAKAYKAVIDGMQRNKDKIEKLTAQINQGENDLEKLKNTLQKNNPGITENDINSDPLVKKLQTEIGELKDKRQKNLTFLQEKHDGVAKTKEHWKMNKPGWYTSARQKVDMNVQEGERFYDVYNPISTAVAWVSSPLTFLGSSLMSGLGSGLKSIAKSVVSLEWKGAFESMKQGKFSEHVKDGLKENWNNSGPAMFTDNRSRTNNPVIDAAHERVTQEAQGEQQPQGPNSN